MAAWDVAPRPLLIGLHASPWRVSVLLTAPYRPSSREPREEPHPAVGPPIVPPCGAGGAQGATRPSRHPPLGRHFAGEGACGVLPRLARLCHCV